MSGAALSLRIVRAIDYANDAHWNHPVNLYPHHTAYFVLGGDGHVRVGEQVLDLQAGHSYLIPANTLYACWCNSSIRKLYVEFYLETASGLDVFLGQNHILTHSFPVEKTQALLRDMAGRTTRDQLRFEGGLMCAIADMMGEQSPTPREDVTRLGPVVQDIVHHLNAELRIADLARRHGWQASSLSRAFVKAYGCSPKQYMSRLLVNVLKRDLLLSDLSISELAAKYHFCDAYYLSNFFKRHMGISPQNYREAVSRVVPPQAKQHASEMVE